jgi:hypothetical protein
MAFTLLIWIGRLGMSYHVLEFVSFEAIVCRAVVTVLGASRLKK